MLENENILYWIQRLASDGQWEDVSAHHTHLSARNIMTRKRETTPNKYRVVKRVTTVMEED